MFCQIAGHACRGGDAEIEVQVGEDIDIQRRLRGHLEGSDHKRERLLFQHPAVRQPQGARIRTGGQAASIDTEPNLFADPGGQVKHPLEG